jgi:hypothetical protein
MPLLLTMVQVDIADVPFLGELGFHFKKRAAEEQVGLAPEHGGAHFAGGRTDFAGEKFLVLEVDVDGGDEFFAVEKGSDGDFDAVDAALKLEDFDFVGESSFVGFEHADDVFAVFFFPDEQAALDVLGFPTGFDDVAVRILLDELNGGIKGIKVFVGDDGDARGFQFFLTERTIVFQAVRVRRTANDGLAGGAEGLSFSALAESVVEHDDIRPFGVFFPIRGFGDETVGDVALFFSFDVITDVVAFLEDLPGDVTDQTGKRNKKKFAFIHRRASGVSFCAERMMAL